MKHVVARLRFVKAMHHTSRETGMLWLTRKARMSEVIANAWNLDALTKIYTDGKLP